MDYSQSLSWLYHTIGKGIKLGLNNTTRILDKLGNPHQTYPTVLVGGTNGKGSVSCFLAYILSQAGLKVGLYTSPHLVTVRERISLVEKGIRRIISPPSFSRLLEKVREVVENSSLNPTYFEILTVSSLLYFSWRKVEVGILEVGMGGRLDSTNVVTPLLSIITNVSFDHMRYLGNTLRDIAREKGGIIKENVPLITGAEGEALEVLEDIASRCGSPIFILGRDFRVGKVASYSKDEIRVDVEGLKGRYSLRSSLYGEFQAKNIALAVAGAEILSSTFPKISKRSIIEGIRKTRWPGRMEIVRKKPLIILDGAHNEESIRWLVREIEKWKGKGRKITLIFGVLKDKEAERIINLLFPHVDEIRLTQPATSRAFPLSKLLEKSEKFSEKIRCYPRVKDALLKLPFQNIILVTGSLYLVGEVRRELRKLKGDGYEGI